MLAEGSEETGTGRGDEGAGQAATEQVFPADGRAEGAVRWAASAGW
jgi:hypothetical protein